MNYIKRLAIAFLLISLVSCKLNDKNTSIEKLNFLTKSQMLEDYEAFKSIYINANAGLYKYRTKEKIDSIFMSNKKLISKKTSYREFYNILWDVIDYTGSCHNSLKYLDSLDKSLNKEKIFFPLPLKHINGKLYTNLEYDKIPAGSEITSVNNVPVNLFSTLISKYASTDGFNKTGKYASIETDWLPFYIYLAFGKQNHFEIKHKKGSSKIKESRLSSINYKTFKENYKKRYSKKYENRKSKDYTYNYLDSIHTGYLEVNTFAMGDQKSEGHKKYVSFLDSVFVNLKSKNIPNLIVDIRGNGGGNDPNDLLLYSYLTKRGFKENTAAFTLFHKIPNQEYYVYDDIKELANELKEEHSIFRNGKYYQNITFNKIWHPNKNAFNGGITLLIDPFVASAGSLFASLLKSDKNAVVIGEETLGGYYGHTGHIPVTYELPNSKLDLTFSIVNLEQDVRQLLDEKYGDGVKPDFRVVQTYHDFLNNKDTQLNFAIEKIKTEMD